MPTPSFAPCQTAAALGAELRSGRLDPCGLVEETLAAIAEYPDKAVFIEVTAHARARRRRPRAPVCGPGFRSALSTAFRWPGRICSIFRAG